MELSKVDRRYCYVCGFDFFKDEALSEKLVKPFNVCMCCVFHYGVDDTLYGTDCFTEYRREWVDKGLTFCGNLYPNDITWTIEEALSQLQNLKKIETSDEYFKRIMLDSPNWTTEVDEAYIIDSWNKARNTEESPVS